jgi:hypothetical protein
MAMYDTDYIPNTGNTPETTDIAEGQGMEENEVYDNNGFPSEDQQGQQHSEDEDDVVNDYRKC